MKSWIQFITTPTADTPGTCMILHFDTKCYLVGNLHEGAQRACTQRAIKLLRVSDVFLTGTTQWKNTGGLLGLVLTLADATSAAEASVKEKMRFKRVNLKSQMKRSTENLKENGEANKQADDGRRTLTVHGGPNLMHTLATARKFVFRKGMPVDVDEHLGDSRSLGPEPTWMDQNIKVWAMSISPKGPRNSLHSSHQSPRKRSFDEFRNNKPSTVARPETFAEVLPEDERDRAHQIRRAVVSEMFDSTWRLDALVETSLKCVDMPAALFIRNPDTKLIEEYKGPRPGDPDPVPDIKVLLRRPWPGALIEELPPTEPSSSAISYIIRNHPQRGKFLPEKARALKVKQGKDFSILARGENVVSSDGKTISPDMVLEPGKVGNGVAVVDLPSPHYVHDLVARQEWRDPEIMAGVKAIIWILGSGIGQNEELREFMDEFKHLKHVVSSQDHCPNYLSFDASASSAIRLNKLDPAHFPLLLHDNALLPQAGQPPSSEKLQLNAARAERGQVIQLEPKFEIQSNLIAPPLNTARVLREIPERALSLAKAVRKELMREAKQQVTAIPNLPSPDAEIICLGTGSALPSKYRNVSATLLRVPSCGSYLMDCGENTLGQLKRIFTPGELSEVLRDLKLIWISHLHADHHLGTTSVIKAWYEEVYKKEIAEGTLSMTTPREKASSLAPSIKQERRLFIASGDSFVQWLREYSSVEDFGFDKLIPLSVRGALSGLPESTEISWNGRIINFNNPNTDQDIAMRASAGLTSLAACHVSHCHGAQAVSITFPTGFKFSYSGDCRPSRQFAEIGRGSTVLLHEATFDDELLGDAIAKKHSTTNEAIQVGLDMNAKRVILTHFSQRYQKLPVLKFMEASKLDGGAEASKDITESVDINGNRAVRDARPHSGGVEEGFSMEENMTDEPGGGNAGITPDMRLSPSSSPAAKAHALPAAAPNAIRKVYSPPPVASDAAQKIPLVPTEKVYYIPAAAADMKIGVAFDYMRVKVGEIAQLEKFTPALMQLFEKEGGDDTATVVAEKEGEKKVEDDR